MKIVVFGSTGGTGREIVRQALQLGHDVTAFACRPQAVGMAYERLRIVEGDALEQTSVDAAIDDQDSVPSAPWTRTPVHLHRTSTRLTFSAYSPPYVVISVTPLTWSQGPFQAMRMRTPSA
jgi:putative NADH-flavin reductase